MRIYLLCLLLSASVPAFSHVLAEKTETSSSANDSLKSQAANTQNSNLKIKNPSRRPATKKKEGFDFVPAGQIFDFTVVN
jgi:hypothetical protein